MTKLPGPRDWTNKDEEAHHRRREQFLKQVQDERRRQKEHDPVKSLSPYDWPKPKSPPPVTPDRDPFGKWTFPPKTRPLNYTSVAEEPLKDWRVLLRDLTARTIAVVDMETGETDTYYRRQKSGEDELLWYSKKDMLEPEGHPIERMKEMWDRVWVTSRYVAGFEPPHTCVGKTAGGCPPCIEQAKVLAGEKNRK